MARIGYSRAISLHRKADTIFTADQLFIKQHQPVIDLDIGKVICTIQKIEFQLLP